MSDNQLAMQNTFKINRYKDYGGSIRLIKKRIDPNFFLLKDCISSIESLTNISILVDRFRKCILTDTFPFTILLSLKT